MSERKNLDRLFQEKFKDFEVTAPEDAWANIDARLRDKKKRRVVPFWFQLSGIAAALVIGWIIFQNNYINGNVENSIVNEQEIPDQREGEIANPAKFINPGNQNGVASEEVEVTEGAQSNGQGSNTGTVKNSEERRANTQNRSTNKKVNVNSDYRNNQNRSLNQVAGVDEPKRVGTDIDSDESNFNGENNRQSVILNKAGQTQSVRTQNELSNRDLSKSVAETNKKSEKNGERRNLSDVQSGSVKSGGEDLNNANQGVASNKEVVSEDASKSLIKDNTTIIAEVNPDDEKIDTTAIATVVPNSLEELLNEKENNVTTKEPKVNRWQISSNVAPIYFSSSSNGSPIDPEFSQNSKDFKQNLAYGLGVRYAINNKLTLRAGVNTIGMEYSTNDVVFYQNSNARPLQHINVNVQGSVIQIENKKSDQLPELTLNDNPMQKFDAVINQRTGYIEVPMELSYKVLDKKFGLEIIGGMSTLFLNENEVSVSSSGTEMEIGKATNLNNTHFSTNLGLGLRYNFFKSFQFNFEPMFKYQINTYTESGNFKPYFFGLYTGINYRF